MVKKKKGVTKYPGGQLEAKVNQVSEPVIGYAIPTFNLYEQAFLSQKGLPVSTLKSIAKNLHLTNQQMADLFEVSEKTLRTKIKKSEQLKAHETDLALSLLELIREGFETFENEENFLMWLHSSWEALGNQRPFDLMRSVSGTKYLVDELRNIRHGIFA